MDLRIEQIFFEEMKKDTSFTEKEHPLFRMRFRQKDMREAWNSGIKHGIEIGLRKASLEGQIIELTNNVKKDRHKDFLDAFYKLAMKYECIIQYHPEKGMVIIDTKNT